MRKNGERFQAEIRGKASAYRGRAVRITAVLDITERKKAEEKLRESDKRFRSLIQHSSDVVMLMSGDGIIEYVSPSVRRVWGFAPKDLVGTDAYGLVHPDDAQRVRDFHVEGNETPGVKPLELRMRRADGSWRFVEGIGNNLLDEPSVRGIVVTIRDVTERKKIEVGLRESEERFRLLVKGVKDYAIFTLVPAGRVTSWNEGARRIKGYEPEEIIGEHFSRFYPEEDLQRGKPEREIEVALAEGRVEDEGWRVRRDGSRFWANVVITTLRDEAGRLRGFSKVTRDITERKNTEDALKESEKRFRSLVQNASDLITVMGIDGTILYESPAIERILGYAPENLIKSNALDFIHPDDRPQVLRAFARLAEETGANPYVEYRFRHEDGSWRHLESSGTNLLDEPSVGGIVFNSRDVTERKLLEERLIHQALHDPLTGLPNRALFMDRLTHALDRARRRDASWVAVLFLDLDDFKVVNDSLGHEAGDDLLVAAAGRLRASLRPEDTLARLGGDEFVVLLEDVVGRGEATEVAARVAGALRGPFSLGAHEEVFVSASVGIALGGAAKDRPAEVPEELLRRADMAMYEAKRKGKAHHEVFEQRMNVPALERLRVGTDLRRAIERGEFRVHYQPEVSLKTGEVVGFEALVRWEHPEQGLISPARFIPVAEETGMIVPIGRWVLEEACRRSKEWREQRAQVPSLVMSVNLSARQFGHPDLVRDVAQALGESGLDPGCLVLEITESAVMEDARSTVGTLGELKALGVGIAVDDFGTGYSSLSYLKRFPVDFLKVDRSFVDDLGEDPEDVVLVSGIVDLAHALGLTVVAEGVETEEQLELLRAMGCNLAQGYHFARPMPGEQVEAFLAARAHPVGGIAGSRSSPSVAPRSKR